MRIGQFVLNCGLWSIVSKWIIKLLQFFLSPDFFLVRIFVNLIDMKCLLLFLFIFKFYSTTESFDLQDIGKSATDVAKGIIEKIPDAIPSPEDLFQSGKNLIAGYPFEQVILNSFIFLFLKIKTACFVQ